MRGRRSMPADLVSAAPRQMPLADVYRLGETLAQSGAFADVRSAAAAIVKILAGVELGVGPITAMTSLYVVKGRVTMHATLIAARIKSSGRYDYRVVRSDDAGCAIAWLDRGEKVGESTFTLEDARKAGLTNS